MSLKCPGNWDIGSTRTGSHIVPSVEREVASMIGFAAPAGQRCGGIAGQLVGHQEWFLYAARQRNPRDDTTSLENEAAIDEHLPPSGIFVGC